jgi:integrase/recombinase XerD
VHDIQQLFDEFIWESEFSRKLRPDTLKSYRDTFALFIKIMPDIEIKEINTSTITTFFKILNERKRVVGKGRIKVGIKKSTVATYWSKLSSFFSWLERNNRLITNPFKQMIYPSVRYEDKKFLKKEQVEKIFTAIYIHHNNSLLILKRNLALFHLLLFCGLRREEVLLLHVRDIDLERKMLTVRSQTSKSGTTRQLPLASNVLTALKDYLNQRKRHTTANLFVSGTGDRPFTYDGMKHLVCKLGIASGVKFHLHQFRHTFAINFLKQSNNLFKLKQLMGHKDIRMTAVYLRCLPVDEMRADIEKMSIDSLI